METAHNPENTNENLSLLPQSARIEVIQMLHDLRPVAQIQIVPKFKDQMLPVLKALEFQGISIVSLDDRHYFASKDSDLAKEAAELFNNGSVSDHARFGELMGFPKGSIEAFTHNKEDVLSDDDLEKILGFKNMFAQVRLSKINFDESVLYLKKVYGLLLEECPDILEEEGITEGVARFVRE